MQPLSINEMQQQFYYFANNQPLTMQPSTLLVIKNQVIQQKQLYDASYQKEKFVAKLLHLKISSQDQISAEDAVVEIEYIMKNLQSIENFGTDCYWIAALTYSDINLIVLANRSTPIKTTVGKLMFCCHQKYKISIKNSIDTLQESQIDIFKDAQQIIHNQKAMICSEFQQILTIAQKNKNQSNLVEPTIVFNTISNFEPIVPQPIIQQIKQKQTFETVALKSYISINNEEKEHLEKIIKQKCRYYHNNQEVQYCSIIELQNFFKNYEKKQTYTNVLDLHSQSNILSTMNSLILVFNKKEASISQFCLLAQLISYRFVKLCTFSQLWGEKIVDFFIFGDNQHIKIQFVIATGFIHTTKSFLDCVNSTLDILSIGSGFTNYVDFSIENIIISPYLLNNARIIKKLSKFNIDPDLNGISNIPYKSTINTEIIQKINQQQCQIVDIVSNFQISISTIQEINEQVQNNQYFYNFDLFSIENIQLVSTQIDIIHQLPNYENYQFSRFILKIDIKEKSINDLIHDIEIIFFLWNQKQNLQDLFWIASIKKQFLYLYIDLGSDANIMQLITQVHLKVCEVSFEQDDDAFTKIALNGKLLFRQEVLHNFQFRKLIQAKIDHNNQILYSSIIALNKYEMSQFTNTKSEDYETKKQSTESNKILSDQIQQKLSISSDEKKYILQNLKIVNYKYIDPEQEIVLSALQFDDLLEYGMPKILKAQSFSLVKTMFDKPQATSIKVIFNKHQLKLPDLIFIIEIVCLRFQNSNQQKQINWAMTVLQNEVHVLFSESEKYITLSYKSVEALNSILDVISVSYSAKLKENIIISSKTEQNIRLTAILNIKCTKINNINNLNTSLSIGPSLLQSTQQAQTKDDLGVNLINISQKEINHLTEFLNKNSIEYLRSEQTVNCQLQSIIPQILNIKKKQSSASVKQIFQQQGSENWISGIIVIYELHNLTIEAVVVVAELIKQKLKNSAKYHHIQTVEQIDWVINIDNERLEILFILSEGYMNIRQSVDSLNSILDVVGFEKTVSGKNKKHSANILTRAAKQNVRIQKLYQNMQPSESQTPFTHQEIDSKIYKFENVETKEEFTQQELEALIKKYAPKPQITKFAQNEPSFQYLIKYKIQCEPRVFAAFAQNLSIKISELGVDVTWIYVPSSQHELLLILNKKIDIFPVISTLIPYQSVDFVNEDINELVDKIKSLKVLFFYPQSFKKQFIKTQINNDLSQKEQKEFELETLEKEQFDQKSEIQSNLQASYVSPKESKELPKNAIKSALISFEANLSMVAPGIVLNMIIIQFTKHFNPVMYISQIINKVQLETLSKEDANWLLGWLSGQELNTFDKISMISKFRSILNEEQLQNLQKAIQNDIE